MSDLVIFLIIFLAVSLSMLAILGLNKLSRRLRNKPLNLVLGFFLWLILLFGLVCGALFSDFLFIFENPRLFTSALQIIAYLSALFLLFYIIRAIVLRKADRVKKNLGLVVVTVCVSAFMAVCLFMVLPNSGIISVREHYIEDINYVYNEDGSIKHNQDGEKVLDTDYGSRTVQKSVSNYGYLILPLVGNGALIYGLVKTAKPAPQPPAAEKTGASPQKTQKAQKK